MRKFVCFFVGAVAILGGAAGKAERLEAELPPETYDEYSIRFAKDKPIQLKATFAPKNLTERNEDECGKFALKFYKADGEWFNEVTGKYLYVENDSGNEVLACIAESYWSWGKLQDAKPSQWETVTVRVINRNIWKGQYVVDSSNSLVPTPQ